MMTVMKKVVLSVVSVLVAGAVFAQHIAWDSTFHPAGYDLKVGLFESYRVVDYR
jgi:hypothetical protein